MNGCDKITWLLMTIIIITLLYEISTKLSQIIAMLGAGQ